jgi:hypothetical protein
VTSLPADPRARPIRPRLRVLLLLAVVLAALALAVDAAGTAAAIPSSAFTWTELAPATKPPAREGAAMAYDPAGGQLILFGGGVGGGQFKDTWAWDGTGWEMLAPTKQPPRRYGASMAYDPASGQLILFGGYSASTGLFNDTWAWSGTDWEQLTPTKQPNPRWVASMAYDPAGGQLILFGGSNGGGLNDTWAWTGTDWEQLTPTVNPPARLGATIAYDPAGGRLILFGGFYLSTGLLNDTWAWDGTNWKELKPTKQPPAREAAAMAYDPAGERLDLFGGRGGSGLLNDTWAWTGTDWEQLMPTTSPSARSLASSAYDDASEQLILFGGTLPGGGLSQETWSYHPFAPPTATIATPADGGGYLLNQSVPTAFTCAESAEAPGVRSCLDPNGAAAGVGSLDTGTVGPHTYTVTATSEDGLSSTSSIHYTVSAPATTMPPSPQVPPPAAMTTIHYNPNHRHAPNRAGGPRYTFRFSATVAGVSFYCSLDNGPFKPCGSPRVYRNLKPGRHVFRLRSVDPAGLESPVQTVRFRAGRRG